MKKEMSVIDLFCGAGGLSTGFSRAGFKISLGIDNDETALKTLSANHKNTKILCGDITKISSNNITKLIGSKKPDAIIGGPPCQGFSMAGKRKPNDPRNSLFKEYLRIVRELKPNAFVMENVRGLLSMKNQKGKRVIDIILQEFRKIKGYNIRCYSVNTADYGAPQKRQRIFIIGVKKRYIFAFPSPTHSRNSNKNLPKWVGIKNILFKRKKIPEKYFYSDKLIKGFLRREKENKKKGVGFGWQFNQPDSPSYTISARYWKDGAESLIRYSDGAIRMLTPEECAAIQTFPKNYVFKGNEREIYTQIGNAVPPLIAKKIACAIRNAIRR